VIVNRDPSVRGPYTAFAEVAGAYERGRPGYPEEAVRWLAGDEPCDVVDLGAGTGKLTRSLVALGHRVTAVEPLDEMRAQLEASMPTVQALAGSAEEIPLPDAEADVVTCAQAFHWFDHTVAMPEVARVLRPGGRLALVWNSRDDRDPWMARLSEILGNETVEESDVLPEVAESGLFGPVETAQFTHEQVLDRDGLLDLVLSRSYCAKLPSADREPMLEAVGALYDTTAGQNGVSLPYITVCFRAQRRKLTSPASTIIVRQVESKTVRKGHVTNVRAKGQVTIPAHIRQAARLEEGDPVEMELVDGGILLRPMKLIDASQAWFWTPEWQAGEREADADLAAGRSDRYESDEEFIAALRARMTPRDADA